MTQVDAEFGKKKGATDMDQDVSVFDAPNLSADEYADHTANQVANAFQATRLFEVVEVKAAVGQIHLMGRVKQEQEKSFIDKVVGPVLKAIDKEKDCEGHVGKQYLLKHDQVRYAWVVSFAANNLRAAAFAICESIREAIPRKEVMETPLRGPATPQGVGGRKGARPVT